MPQQGSTCMWSEHVIRSALPGKPNLRSKLCQVTIKIVDLMVLDFDGASNLHSSNNLNLKQINVRCTLRHSRDGAAD